MRFKLGLALLPLLLAGCATTGQQTPKRPLLKTQDYGVTTRSARTLYVIVHGDGVRANVDTSQFAQKLAEAEPTTAVVRLLRPGYSDAQLGLSPGNKGVSGGDDYNLERLYAVGDTIAALKRRYPRAHVIGIGEAGGAVMIANLAGVRHKLLDGIVLVSCPCALPEWRSYSAAQEPNEPRWRDKSEGLDPLHTAGGISPQLRAAILSGAADTRIPYKFSRSYAEALSLRGIATDFRILPERKAPMLDDPQVIDASRRVAASLPSTGR